MTIGELVEAAYLDGWRRGIEAYAWWKDGRQLVGSGRFTLSEAQRAAPEEAGEAFKLFIEKQKERHEGAKQ